MSDININIWKSSQFRAYLASTGFSGFALAMQQLLASWILIGILELPANEVGPIQALIGIPGIFLMLIGGASADREDPRRLLMLCYFFAPVFPLFLVVMELSGYFAVWSVVVWGLGIGTVQALSMPAQQAILNRAAGAQVQKGVTAATAIGFVVQVVGLGLAGQIDLVGVEVVLLMQGIAFAIAGWTLTLLEPVPATRPLVAGSAMQRIGEGLRATLGNEVISRVLVINFASSIFNAGSFMTVFPFIVKRIYEGDALILAALMALFFSGAALSNAMLLRFMPLARPGRVYLVAQYSRIIVLFLMFLGGPWWMLMLATLLWGLNMGVTTNLARMIVQESSDAAYRGRILSVFSISMMGSAPVGAVVLGILIEQIGTLEALLPAMGVSFVLASYGLLMTRIWQYRSPQAAAV